MFRAPLFIASAWALLASSPACAHHSRALYDMTKEITLDGTVAELAWKNPHIFVTVEARGEDGKLLRVEVEVTSVSEAAALGLPREAVEPGARVTVRAHPGRNSAARAVGLVVTTADGRAYPLNTDARLALRPTGAPAAGIAGRWAPTLESFNTLLPVMQSWSLTEAGQAARAQAFAQLGSPTVAALGICEPFPAPLLAIFPDLRTIEVNDATVEMRFEGAVGVTMERTVHMNREHPADVVPSLMGHSVGRWDGETLVIDTVGFTAHHLGVLFFPGGARKHLVERLTLTPDRLALEYSFTLEDPDMLASPASYTARWDHRPDLEPSGVACDPDVARRTLHE